MKKYLILERIWNNPVLGNRNFWILREKLNLNFTSILTRLNKNRLLWLYFFEIREKTLEIQKTLVKHDQIVESSRFALPRDILSNCSYESLFIWISTQNKSLIKKPCIIHVIPLPSVVHSRSLTLKKIGFLLILESDRADLTKFSNLYLYYINTQNWIENYFQPEIILIPKLLEVR